MTTQSDTFLPWEGLNFPDDEATFHQAWLMQLVLGLGQGALVREAVLVGGAVNHGPFRPQAFWPQGQTCSAGLAQVCEQALAMRMPISRQDQQSQQAELALPIMSGDDVFGVLALCFGRPQIPAHAQEWVRWGYGWLLARHFQHDSTERQTLREQLMNMVDLVLLSLSQPRALDAAQAVLSEAALHLGCERVSFGLARGQAQVRLFAISNVADFSHRLDLARALEAAMDEALDQGCDLQLSAPATTDAPVGAHIVREQAALLQSTGHGCVLSVPLALGQDWRAAFVFEWQGADPAPALFGFARSLVPVLGQVLHGRQQQQRPWWTRARDTLRLEAERLFGPRHAIRKAIAAGIVLLTVFFSVAHGDFRVPAQAVLEGSVRRQIVAPFDGYVASADMRAGQLVDAGATLALLDDRELRLESVRWASQEEQYSRQMSDAQAQKNLAQIQISLAQTRQADAQHALSESMLERAHVVAPFAGVIVSGDLSQQLGAAVRKGQLLFEISPLDEYRVVLQVDESDIAYMAVGQKGQLVLTALPGNVLNFTTSLVTPVAEARDGKNLFRVEARLDSPLPQLRPGMEGVGKVVAGDHLLIWIWTRRLGDWLRLQAWSWFGV